MALACAAPFAPEPDGPPIAPAWADAAAVTLDVDLDRGRVSVVREGALLGRTAMPVGLEVGAWRVTPVGVDAPPGRRRVHLDVGVQTAPGVNRFDASSLVAHPPGVRGAVVISYDAAVVPLPGAARVQDGTVVVVELPSAGRVVPSHDFDGDGTSGSGAPFPFFATRRCTAVPDRGCFRYETFRAPADRRAVGFDIDPTVRRFRARLLVAADVTAP